MRVEDFTEFVVFAKHLNFSRAATELHLTQPTLSKHIAALEHELGSPLVTRGRQLCLTPAGEAFLVVAQRIKAVVDREMQGFEVALREHPPVRVLEMEHVESSGLLAAIDGIPIDYALDTGERSYFASLLDGSVDVNITYDVSVVPDLREQAVRLGIEITPIGLMPGAMLVMSHSPLGQLEALRHEDLKGRSLAIVGRGPFDDWSRCLVDNLGCDLGLRPVLMPVGGNMRNLERMDFGEAILALNRSVIDELVFKRHDVRVFHQLDGRQIAFPLAMLWRHGERNPNVIAFVKAARGYFAEHGLPCPDAGCGVGSIG